MQLNIGFIHYSFHSHSSELYNFLIILIFVGFYWFLYNASQIHVLQALPSYHAVCWLSDPGPTISDGPLELCQFELKLAMLLLQ